MSKATLKTWGKKNQPEGWLYYVMNGRFYVISGL